MTTIPEDAEPIDDTPPELWGALADLMAPVESVDLTGPVGGRGLPRKPEALLALAGVLKAG